tara:strand:+ start:810 stop:1601 length:792 start_codon:yes stop_codon:yes gene_type:complete
MESFNSRLERIVKERNSWLCVGLDISSEQLGISDINKLKDYTFSVIDATRELAVAYKPNFAFFERWGSLGFDWLEKTITYIGDEHLTIADAKRGDIGNTAEQYAKSIFGHFGFDSVTINPYMGSDSIKPFINEPDKGVFVLCRTSNYSAKELQDRSVGGLPVYQLVADLVKNLNVLNNMGLVLGATKPNILSNIREIAPYIPFLIPGVGVQGGELSNCLKVGNKKGVGIINISRGISFVGDKSKKAIHSAAINYVEQMREILN